METAPVHRLDRRLRLRLIAHALVATACTLAGCESPERAPPTVDASPLAIVSARIDAGPMIGSVTQTGARVWVHVDGIESLPGGLFSMRLIVEDPTATDQRASDAIASVDSGGSAIFRIEGLRPGTNYSYRIVAARDEAPLSAGRLRTQPTRVPETRVAFGSCADIDPSTARTWKAIEDEHPDALVLLGDTPYIDTTGLAVQRERYLQFAQAAGFASLIAKTPLYSVWDDHDFGANNTDGRLAGKSNSRRAFIENRPNPSYGEGAAGIFTSFRQGEVEVDRGVGHALGRDSEVLVERRGGARRAEAGHPDKPPLRTDPPLPAEAAGGLAGHPGRHGLREDALPVGGILLGKELPARHAHDAWLVPLVAEDCSGLEAGGDLAAGADEDAVGLPAGGILEDVSAAGGA